ncbi:MAG: carbohydrate ABC transporter permease [Fimbriimonas sp.]
MSTGRPTKLSWAGPLNRTARLFWQLVLTAVALLMVAPLFWMLSTSFKPEREVLTTADRWLPKTPTVANYLELANRAEEFPVGRWFLNSLGVSLVTTLLVVTVASLAAYAFARLRFRGRDALFLGVVATMAVPSQVTLIPVFLVVQRLGLFNSYAGLILPGVASAFGVFLLRQFFSSIPRELEEAAFLDGAGHLRTFAQVILPLGKPAVATLAIFTFIGSWNDFVWPLIVTNDVEMRTLPVGLSIFQGRYTTEYGLTMAAAAAMTIPAVLAFVIFQRRITEGIALTGLK